MLITEFFFETKKITTKNDPCWAGYHMVGTKKQEVAEDSWSGPNNAWHNEGQDDQWYDGKDQWHGEQGAGMVEDFAVTNLVSAENVDFEHITTAKKLLIDTINDPLNEKHKYFEFLKELNKAQGPEYSNNVHKHAAKLAIAKEAK
jgi:hypothetical protein